MTVRYIADLHLYDPAVTYWEVDPETRVPRLIDNWNNIVLKDDVTFILGDIGPSITSTFDTLSELYGLKILVRGNHDDIENWSIQQRRVFDAIYDYILSNNVLLIHRPQDRLLFTSDMEPSQIDGCFINPLAFHKNKAKWVIHGHLHTVEAIKVAGDYKQYIREPNRYNCAADLIGLCPRTVQELAYYKDQVVSTEKEL